MKRVDSACLCVETQVGVIFFFSSFFLSGCVGAMLIRRCTLLVCAVPYSLGGQADEK